MRLLHTADWHLGHTLHDHPRDSEHKRFLDWLLDTLHRESVDALLIAGDVFETANPPVRAQEMWFTFLAQARERCPDLDIVVIGGNHDSALRLDAPRKLFDALRLNVVGGLPRLGGRGINMDRVLLPLHDRAGQVAALVAAVPYLRVSDLPRVDAEDPLREGVRAVYADVMQAASRRLKPGQALIAMGHAYMQGTQLSDDSERKILGGNQHALPPDIFSPQLAYVALGHLHFAQEVGSPQVRYSGSPIPLSMTERAYQHQVLLVELDGPDFQHVRPLPIPRHVELLRIPDQDFLPLPELLEQLTELPNKTGLFDQEAPFLEVRVLLEQPEPDLRRQIEEAVQNKAVRLVSVRTEYSGHGLAPADQGGHLEQLTVEEVFERCWERLHNEGEMDEALRAGFHQLVERAQQEAP